MATSKKSTKTSAKTSSNNQLESHYEKCAYGSLICDAAGLFILGGVFGIIAIVMGAVGLRSNRTPVRVIAGIGIGIGIFYLLLIVMSIASGS